MLITAIHTYAKHSKTIPNIFNLKIIVVVFPDNVNREAKANKLGGCLRSIHQSITQLIRVTIKNLIENNTNIDDMEKVRKLQVLQTICYILIYHKCYITLIFEVIT